MGAAESFYICRRCRGMRLFPTKEMDPTFGRGHFPTKEMGPTFGRRHFPTKEEDMPQLMEQTINTFNHLTKEVQ